MPIRPALPLSFHALAALALSGCGAVAIPEPAAGPPPPDASPITATEGERCVSFHRELTLVADARVAQRWPDSGYGNLAHAVAGEVSGADNDLLVRFDLREVPSHAHVTRARLSIVNATCWADEADVTAHRVLRPWDEHEVTWRRFATGYEREPVGSLHLPGGTEDGRVALDVTEAVRDWVRGTRQNEGLAVRAHGASASFATSEASDPGSRPRLEVCYSVTEGT